MPQCRARNLSALVRRNTEAGEMAESYPGRGAKGRAMKTAKTASKSSSAKARSPRNGKSAPEYDLKLYVAGQTRCSLQALSNLKRICDEHLAGRYRLSIVDLMQTPQLAKGDQIVAIPTLVRKQPQPARKIIGDLSDTERVLTGLDLPAAKGVRTA